MHITRRKELYEKLHPETQKGATGKGRPKKSLAFIDDAAKKTGKNRSTIARDGKSFTKSYTRRLSASVAEAALVGERKTSLKLRLVLSTTRRGKFSTGAIAPPGACETRLRPCPRAG